MLTPTIRQLDAFGPDHCETLSIEQARAYCRRLATGHYENFSVLSGLVPADRRDDFAAVYAFCRWADDLGDEIDDRGRSLELLAWWRRELEACFAQEPRHPVFIALAPTVRARELPIDPFDDLIRAFEQDQTTTRYASWDELIAYCRLSADPVGRLVLMVLGEARDAESLRCSDAVCTALQLTNHWQDVARDMADRDRIYLPSELHSIEDFESRLRRSVAQGYAIDHEFLDETRQLVRACVDRTWPLFREGEKLLERVSPRSRTVIWLFLAGGTRILRLIEMWNFETALHRPRLGRTTKALLLGRAWFRTLLAQGREGGT